MNGVKRAERYVRDVLKSPSLYPDTIHQACVRYNSDKKRKDIYLDVGSANYVVGVVESMPHTKGMLQGQPMLLEDWQCFFYANVFGWKWSDTKLRRFKYANLFVPRKNGKTAMAIPAALLMFVVDREPGSEVYLGAVGDRHAKRLLYKPARYICEKYEEFTDKYNIEVGATSITTTDNDSVLTTVIKNPNDGDSPHCAVVDEYHEHKDSGQYDTFDTGTDGRRQPLLLIITTAGTDLSSPCKTEYDDSIKVLNGSYSADDKFVQIYAPDEGDDWKDIEVLKKVNPNFGVSINEKGLLSKLEKATQSAEKQSAFKTKHCNIWVGSKSPWLNVLLWQRQAKPSLNIDDFRGEKCHITCDLASTIDVCSLHVTFYRDGHFYSFPYFYIPEIALVNVGHYQRFVDAGEMTVTEGDMADYDFIKDQIVDLGTRFDISSIAFDPHQATLLQAQIAKETSLGEKLVTYSMNRPSMSEPMNELEGRVTNRQYWHDGNSCMTWMVGNTCNLIDGGERSYPVKENRNDKRCHIDGSVTAIMGVGRWLDEDDELSPYADRGFRTL